VQQALHWTQNGFSVESDCSVAIGLIGGVAPNIYAYAFSINVIR
jgi:hypothetical protein